MNTFNLTELGQTYRNIAIILMAAILLCLPVFIFGIPNGNDLPQHYQFAQTFFESLQNGNLNPGWAGSPNGGYGDIGIRFYPPLAYYILTAFRALSGNWYDASVLTFIFWYFLSGIGVYLWSREWFSKNSALFAALGYMLMPYHNNQIYNAFFYAEFAAAAVLPFCFWLTTRICRCGKTADIAGLAFVYSLLILTHLPMSVIGSIGLLVYSLVLFCSLEREKLPVTFLKLAGSVFLGLLVSLFYWLRMIQELNFVNHATNEFIDTAYDFRSNFALSFFYTAPETYELRSLWFCDLILLMTFAFFIPCAIIFYRKSERGVSRKLLPVLGLLIVSAFFSTPLSLPVWENFSLLQKIQFPFRWFVPVSLAAAVFMAAGFENLVAVFRTKDRALGLITAGLILAGVTFTATQIIKPANYISRENFGNLMIKLRDAESFECWWTIWAKKEALKIKDRILVNNRETKIASWTSTEKTVIFSAGESQTARIATFYYPYWQAEMNGQKIAVDKSDEGAILIELPAEASHLKLFFKEPVIFTAANLVSALTFTFFVFYFASLIRLK